MAWSTLAHPAWGRRLLPLSLLGLLLVPHSLAAQTYSSADQVRNLYRKYLNREPTQTELTQWVWSFQKGMALSEAQATFLASDAYFNRYARSGSSFISGMFTDVLGRAPTSVESLQWLHRLNSSQGDRAKLVREFLLAVQGQVPQSRPSAATTPPPPAPRQPDQLVPIAGLLHNSIEQELGGTGQGRQLSMMSRNLINASRSLENAGTTGTVVYRQALSDVQTALTAVEKQLSQLHFTAQDSSNYLNRFKSVYEGLGGTVPDLAALPQAPPKLSPNQIDSTLYAAYLQLSTSMLSDLQQLMLLFNSTTVQDAQSSQLVRDIEFFRAQTTAVHQTLAVGQDKQDLRHEVLELRALAEGITQRMRQSGRVGRVAQRWQLVQEDVAEIGKLVGVSVGPTIDPGQPVLLNLPTYHQLPYQVQRPTPAQMSSEAIPITDQAIAHLDAFVAGFNRFLHLSPRVPALQAQARQLRVMFGQLRQELANGSPPELITAQLNQIDQALRAVSNLWVRTVQERQLTNTPDLNGITGALQNLKRVYGQG